VYRQVDCTVGRFGGALSMRKWLRAIGHTDMIPPSSHFVFKLFRSMIIPPDPSDGLGYRKAAEANYKLYDLLENNEICKL